MKNIQINQKQMAIVVAKTWLDESFAQSLKDNPLETLKKEGISVSDDFNFDDLTQQVKPDIQLAVDISSYASLCGVTDCIYCQ